MIVENDVVFARFLLDAAREKGFKGLVTPLGASALVLAREYDVIEIRRTWHFDFAVRLD